jgi:hypothetical protein
MNLKLANLIVVQFGIFVGVMAWLVYSHLPSAKPPAAAQMQEITAPIATGAPGFEARNQPPSRVDYSADREQARLMAERSVSLASLQRYEQAIATEPYVNSIPADSPSYAEVNQEPAAVPTDYLESPQTVIYTQPIIVFSNRRRFGDRCRSIHHPGAVNPTLTRQCPDRRNSHSSDPRIVSGPIVGTPPPPSEGFKPREPVRQAGVTGSQQKRVAFPGSPGAARRSLSVP